MDHGPCQSTGRSPGNERKRRPTTSGLFLWPRFRFYLLNCTVSGSPARPKISHLAGKLQRRPRVTLAPRPATEPCHRMREYGLSVAAKKTEKATSQGERPLPTMSP
jgi:hypothetical protein